MINSFSEEHTALIFRILHAWRWKQYTPQSWQTPTRSHSIKMPKASRIKPSTLTIMPKF